MTKQTCLTATKLNYEDYSQVGAAKSHKCWHEFSFRNIIPKYNKKKKKTFGQQQTRAVLTVNRWAKRF